MNRSSTRTMEAARTSLGSGTRHRRYRCSLPGLTGFTAGRRGETDAGHHVSDQIGGGEGGIRTHEHPLRMLLEFQSSAFDRSATSPINNLRGLWRMSLSPPGRSKTAANDKACRRGPHVGCGPVQACGAGGGLGHLEGRGLIQARVLLGARRRGGLTQRGELAAPRWCRGPSSPAGICSGAPVLADM